MRKTGSQDYKNRSEGHKESNLGNKFLNKTELMRGKRWWRELMFVEDVIFVLYLMICYPKLVLICKNY